MTAEIKCSHSNHLRCPAAKDKSITDAAAAPSNLDAANTMRSAEAELQNTIELRATASEIAAPKPTLDPTAKKNTILKHFSKIVLKGQLPAPRLRKSADKSPSQRWCSHSNTIYDVQLQKTKEFRTEPWRQATLMLPSHCDLQPESRQTHRTRTHEQPLVAEHRGGTDSTLKRPQPHPSHTGGSFHRRPKPLHTEKHKFSCFGFPPQITTHAKFMQPWPCDPRQRKSQSTFMTSNLTASFIFESSPILLIVMWCSTHTTIHWV